MMLKSRLRQLYMVLEPYLYLAVSPLLRKGVHRLRRSLLAQRYLRGNGIEIGAFASPTLKPLGSRTRYVDRVPAEYWASRPEHHGAIPVKPDIIDDGGKLDSVDDNSQDFLIAFHMLEHADNAVATLKSWCRVVKSGGHILIGIPNRDHTRDRHRDLTTWEHFERDYREGPQWSARDHYRDVAKNIHGLEGAAAERYAEQTNPSIHFHVWDTVSFGDFVYRTRDLLAVPYDVLEIVQNHQEVIVVLQVRR